MSKDENLEVQPETESPKKEWTLRLEDWKERNGRLLGRLSDGIGPEEESLPEGSRQAAVWQRQARAIFETTIRLFEKGIGAAKISEYTPSVQVLRRVKSLLEEPESRKNIEAAFIADEFSLGLEERETLMGVVLAPLYKDEGGKLKRATMKRYLAASGYAAEEQGKVALGCLLCGAALLGEDDFDKAVEKITQGGFGKLFLGADLALIGGVESF